LSNRGHQLSQLERELLIDLKASKQAELGALPLTAFGICYYREQSVRVYLRPLGRLAEIWQLNPEELRQAVRVHFLYLLLLITGLDLDSQSYVRGEDDPAVQLIVGVHTWKYLKKQSAELSKCYADWVKAWGGGDLPLDMLQEQSAEKVRAAMVFWRRQLDISWDECWYRVNQFKKADLSKDYFQRKTFY